MTVIAPISRPYSYLFLTHLRLVSYTFPLSQGLIDLFSSTTQLHTHIAIHGPFYHVQNPLTYILVSHHILSYHTTHFPHQQSRILVHVHALTIETNIHHQTWIVKGVIRSRPCFFHDCYYFSLPLLDASLQSLSCCCPVDLLVRTFLPMSFTSATSRGPYIIALSPLYCTYLIIYYNIPDALYRPFSRPHTYTLLFPSIRIEVRHSL